MKMKREKFPQFNSLLNSFEQIVKPWPISQYYLYVQLEQALGSVR